MQTPDGLYAIDLENGKNTLTFSYASYDGVEIDSDIAETIEVDYDNQKPEMTLASSSIMEGVTEISGTVSNEEKGWTAELLSNGASVASAASDDNREGFSLDIPQGTDLAHLSVRVTDASGNESVIDVEYVTIAGITAELSEDRIYSDGSARIVGRAQPGASLVVARDQEGDAAGTDDVIEQSINVNSDGSFAFDIPVSRLAQGDNAITLYYNTQSSGFTDEAVAGTGLETPIIIRCDTQTPKVQVTPAVINRDTDAIHIDVDDEIYGWTVKLTEDGDVLFEEDDVSDIPIDPSWQLREEKNGRNIIELFVTDRAGNEVKLPLQYKDSSENNDAYAFSESDRLGVLHQGETLALNGVYIVCNSDDMPDYVTLSIGKYSCSFDPTEVDFDETVDLSGQSYSNYANAAYEITGISMETSLESGDYALQATIETEHGDVGPFDLGTVTVEAADTSTFESTFVRASGGADSGITPDAPSQKSFRANNVVLTGKIDTGVNLWKTLGYFGLQNEDNASVIQYKGNTVNTDALKVYARDGRDDGGFVLNLDLTKSNVTLSNGIYTVRFYTKDDETDEYIEILTARIMIDDSARFIDPESESLRLDWNPLPTPEPTLEPTE